MDTLVDPLVGELLEGRYRIEGRIARGGMATVYRALDERLDRVVAVKVMHPGLAGDAQFLAGFSREARAAARLSSGNVVSVFDQGSHDGLAFLVMELVPGRTLRDVLAEHGPLAPVQAMSLLEPILVALAAAHRAGVVHRDVKPENVLLGDDGSVKVADFGLARAVESSRHTATSEVVIGTVAYLAPEQVATGSGDERTDVYAAGVMLFEMLTGTVPYSGDTALSVAYRHVHEDIPPPSTLVDVPPSLDALTLRATRRDPGARPADAGAFLAELRHVRQDLDLPSVAVPVSSRPAVSRQHTIAVPMSALDDVAVDRPPAHRGRGVRRPGMRRPVPIALLVVLLLGLVAASAGWLIGAARYTRAPELTGLTGAVAAEKAHAAGFRVAYGTEVFSETAPVSSVVTQRPGATNRILKGGTITLILSRGKERHQVPDVTGDSEASAVAALRAAKLLPQISRRSDDTVESGTVLSQSPDAGPLVRRGTLVTIVVSSGPPPVTVPRVVGLNVDDAESQLSDAGLQDDVTRVVSLTVPVDTVIAQQPAGGQLPQQSTVKLTVSGGPPQVAVPDVTGQRLQDAKRQLERAGFTVQVVAIFGRKSVWNQSPGGGQSAPKGSEVTLFAH